MASISTRAFRQGGDGDTGTGRGIGSEGFAVHTVHSLKISHIHDEYGHFGHIGGRGSGFGKDGLHVGKGLRGLFLHIVETSSPVAGTIPIWPEDTGKPPLRIALRIGADGGGGFGVEITASWRFPLFALVRPFKGEHLLDIGMQAQVDRAGMCGTFDHGLLLVGVFDPEGAVAVTSICRCGAGWRSWS